MDIERIDDETTYIEETDTGFPAVAAADGAYTVEPDRLQPLHALAEFVEAGAPDDVAATLGFETGAFDGEPVYHGSLSGTTLQFQGHETGGRRVLLVVSFGESQPGRYACKPEAVLRH